MAANALREAVPWKFANVRESSNCLLLVEKSAAALGSTAVIVRRARDQLRAPAGGFDVATIKLHSRTFNYLFVDGHAARLAPEETVNPVNPKLRTDPILNSGESLGAWTVAPND
ncbi:MAG TPA: hypothetical protein VGN72_03015 [Tepidisphaeraceae bacterium]|nr:hypothetical protein [Tepidisphaeraceae bacterium]